MENDLYAVDVYGADQCLWRYVVKETGRSFAIAPPAFQLEGSRVGGALARVSMQGEPAPQPGGVTEYRYQGQVYGAPALRLEMAFSVAEGSPVVRFRYRLMSEGAQTLTGGQAGEAAVDYVGLSLVDLDARVEVRLEETLVENEIPPAAFEQGQRLEGPILVAGDDAHTLLAAYEAETEMKAGSVAYELTPAQTVRLRLFEKGRQVIDGTHPYETMWMAFAALPGDAGAALDAYQASLGQA